MQPTDHQDADASGAQGSSGHPPEATRRKGLPSADSIISETTITSPKGRVYRVIRTNQKDLYDEPVSKTEAEPGEETGEMPSDQQVRPKRKRPRKS